MKQRRGTTWRATLLLVLALGLATQWARAVAVKFVDASGNALPTQSLTITDAQTGQPVEKEEDRDDRGAAVLILPPGNYNVTYRGANGVVGPQRVSIAPGQTATVSLSGVVAGPRTPPNGLRLGGGSWMAVFDVGGGLVREYGDVRMDYFGAQQGDDDYIIRDGFGSLTATVYPPWGPFFFGGSLAVPVDQDEYVMVLDLHPGIPDGIPETVVWVRPGDVSGAFFLGVDVMGCVCCDDEGNTCGSFITSRGGCGLSLGVGLAVRRNTMGIDTDESVGGGVFHSFRNRETMLGPMAFLKAHFPIAGRLQGVVGVDWAMFNDQTVRGVGGFGNPYFATIADVQRWTAFVALRMALGGD